MKTQLPSTAVFSSSEIQIHYKRPLFNSMRYITNAGDADRILRMFVDLDRIDLKEFFWVILMNRANRVLGISEIAMGGTSSVVVDVKEICQLALLTSSIHVLVAHNHPSGRLSASVTDKEITIKIKEALQLFDITLLDHLIITSELFYSFANEGIL
jgi:DNA repair protein RadC